MVRCASGLLYASGGSVREPTGRHGCGMLTTCIKGWPWQVVGRDSGASDDGIGRGSPGPVGRTESRLCKNFFK